jgi:hypothetical protein
MELPPAATSTIPTIPTISSRAEFQAALLWALQSALARASRRLVLVDPSFAAWPLGSPEVLAALQSWLRLPQRRLVLLAASFDEVPRRHPRFVAWRRDWAHAIECWSQPTELAALPTLMLDDGPLCLQLFASTPLRGQVTLDAPLARRWREEVDVVLQQSEVAFPVHTLGL